MHVVKVGSSRQVAIPKAVHDQLGLSPGDYLEVEVRGNQLILTPKQLVDKRLVEADEDIRKGRVHGPYTSAAGAVRALRRKAR